jgi:hypothetical protein
MTASPYRPARPLSAPPARRIEPPREPGDASDVSRRAVLRAGAGRLPVSGCMQ